MAKTILGLSLSEIERQCAADKIKCDSNSPIQEFETLDPVIAGGEKILADEELTAFFRKIFTGRNDDE